MNYKSARQLEASGECVLFIIKAYTKYRIQHENKQSKKPTSSCRSTQLLSARFGVLSAQCSVLCTECRVTELSESINYCCIAMFVIVFKTN